MSDQNPTYKVEQNNSFKMLKAMVGIGLICALMIVLIFELTLPRIERLRAEALERAIFKVIPGTIKTATFQLDQTNSIMPFSNDNADAQKLYAGFDQNDKLSGIAIEARGQGYADILSILYGYDPETQKIIGFYVLESKETPGLGDKIEKDENFLSNFKALDATLNENKDALKNKIVPVKSGDKKNPWEVDGITGATISSRAIGNIIGSSTAEWIPAIYNNKSAFVNYEEEKLQ